MFLLLFFQIFKMLSVYLGKFHFGGCMSHSENIKLYDENETSRMAQTAESYCMGVGVWACWSLYSCICKMYSCDSADIQPHQSEYQPGVNKLFQHVVPNWKVLLVVFRWMCFSECAYLTLKAPNQSVSPLMTEAHLALSWLVLKARKELGLPQWEVGNWSFKVLYVFLLISSNSLMFVYI